MKIIFILNGGCNGRSIIFAELYGQKNYEKLRKESFLSLSAGGGFTIVLSIVSLLVLSYLLIGRMGLEAVAVATGIGWISVVLYQILVYRKVRKKGFI